MVELIYEEVRKTKISELTATERLDNALFPISQGGITKSTAFESIKKSIQGDYDDKLFLETQNRIIGDKDTLANAKEYANGMLNNAKEYTDEIVENLPIVDIVDLETVKDSLKKLETAVNSLDEKVNNKVEEAPNNEKTYGRKNKAWEEITEKGNGNNTTVSTTTDLVENVSALPVGEFYFYNPVDGNNQLYIGGSDGKARKILSGILPAPNPNPVFPEIGSTVVALIKDPPVKGSQALIYRRKNYLLSMTAGSGGDITEFVANPGSDTINNPLSANTSFTVVPGIWELIIVGTKNGCGRYVNNVYMRKL